jgi:hypothetical protein
MMCPTSVATDQRQHRKYYSDEYTLAERLGVEPSEPKTVLQISNLLHYHPAPAPKINLTFQVRGSSG